VFGFRTGPAPLLASAALPPLPQAAHPVATSQQPPSAAPLAAAPAPSPATCTCAGRVAAYITLSAMSAAVSGSMPCGAASSGGCRGPPQPQQRAGAAGGRACAC
jgi:hypothetical protein